MIQYANVRDRREVIAKPNPYASGYGNKIPTRFQVLLEEDNRWRSVWAICHSNVASFYVIKNGVDLYIRECDLPD